MQKMTRSVRALTLAGLVFLVVAAGSAAPARASQTSGTWTRTGSMTTPREGQTAVLMHNGQVLLMGGSDGNTALSSAELYNPATGKFTATGDMGAARTKFNATALPNGEALITGGEIAGSATSSAELFNPATGTFSPTGSMTTPREFGTATLLQNGQVLVAGGDNSSGTLQSAELFNPATGTFSPTGSMNVPRDSQTATLLQNGQVLMAGGPPGTLPGGSAELYDPTTGTFTNTGSMAFPHYGPVAGLLPDGRVVSVCNISDRGVNPCGAELYNPASGTWSDDGIADSTAQGGYTRTMIDKGQVLISGGASQFGGDKHLRTVVSSEASLFDPGTGNATFTGSMSIPRDGHTLTLLPNGQVLAAGGYTQSNSQVNPKISVTASAELFTP
ncbi:MAG TPA: kelch repeat-containing protein [Gaiellaceae bacterium]|nr:kelch repeat-containing protein [Gaiellaceae bacterium]